MSIQSSPISSSEEDITNVINKEIEEEHKSSDNIPTQEQSHTEEEKPKKKSLKSRFRFGREKKEEADSAAAASKMEEGKETFSLVQARKEARYKRLLHPKKSREVTKNISIEAFSLPPDTTLTEEQIDNLVIRMIDAKNGIEVGTHKRKFKVYENCFSGEAAAKWIESTLNETAIQYGQTMFMNRGIFYSISKNHSSFHDRSDVFYRFRVLENEEVPVLNKSKLYLEEIENPVEVSMELTDLVIKLLLIPHKKDNFKSIAKTKMFKKFMLTTSKLQKVQLEALSEEEKRVFFVNTHNVLIAHAYILFGVPKVQTDVEKSLEFAYQIGPYNYSIRFIRDILLARLPEQLPVQTPRHIIQLSLDPMVHFCLFTGSEQSPTIRTYSADDWEEMSDQQAKQYLNEFVVVERAQNTIILPHMFEVYAQDFGKNKSKFLKNLSDYLPRPERQWILENRDTLALSFVPVSYGNFQFIKESIRT